LPNFSTKELIYEGNNEEFVKVIHKLNCTLFALTIKIVMAMTLLLKSMLGLMLYIWRAFYLACLL
jgi:hypothetical protein